MAKLFKQNKNLDQYKRELISKYRSLGIVANKFGISLSALYNVLNGTQIGINCHVKLAEEFNIPWETYIILLKDIYIEDVFKSKKLAKVTYERINISNERKETS